MERATKITSDEVHERAAAERTGVRAPGVEVVGMGPVAISQRQLVHDIQNSPRVIAQRKQIDSAFGEAAQRRGAEEDELLQGKCEPAQRQGPVEEETLQGRFDTAQREEAPAPPPNRTGLPDRLKAGIEHLSGMSMDGVEVHYNSPQPANLNALAYAQGTDIHVAPGQEQHLPHEAWHIVQQAQGRVKPTMQMKDGVPVNDDNALEREADLMGAKAMQMSRSGTPPLRSPVGYRRETGSGSAAQRVAVDTAGGQWKTTTYEAWGPGYPDLLGSPKGIGAEIAIEFTPGTGAPIGKKIGLIQTVTATVNKKPDPTDRETVPLDKQGRAIDRDKGDDTAPTTSPVYGVHNTSASSAHTLAGGVQKLGENTYGMRNRFLKNKPAKLWDKPSSAVGKLSDEVGKHFETAAVVLEGPNSGQYLGSVKWGYVKPAGKKEPQLDSPGLELCTFGNPSENFVAAANAWNEAARPKGQELVKVPVPI